MKLSVIFNFKTSTYVAHAPRMMLAGFSFNKSCSLSDSNAFFLACMPGFYKSEVANQVCRRCPDYSRSEMRGSTQCDCMSGYFRAHSDTPDVDCTSKLTFLFHKTLNLVAELFRVIYDNVY